MILFGTRSTLNSAYAPDAVKQKLLGKHIQVHHLDFEIMNSGDMLKVIPHAENVDNVKTLPITHLKISSKGGGSKIVMSSKPRRIDVGGPLIVLVFVVFMIIGAIVYYFSNKTEGILGPAAMMGVALITLIILILRLQAGYYDYIRKIKHYLAEQLR